MHSVLQLVSLSVGQFVGQSVMDILALSKDLNQTCYLVRLLIIMETIF